MSNKEIIRFCLIATVALTGSLCCGGSVDDSPSSEDVRFIIPPGITFDWQLTDVTSQDNFSSEVIDLDAFSTSAETVAHFKAQGKIVIAYVSIGSVESFRPDAGDFPAAIIGNVYEGFEDENWLDVRNIQALAPILRARFDMIRDKGFDGIEPDNMNGYQNNTGFNLSTSDAVVFSRWLIEEAHSRGLSIGQKNAEELVPEMADEFDWMLTEDAFADNWYEQVTPYITLGKAVFVTEYTDRMSASEFDSNVCPQSQASQFSAILKERDLTSFTLSCN